MFGRELWLMGEALIMTGTALVKVTTVSLWKDTAYITTETTLVKVTTVSLWNDSLYNDCFPPSQNRLPKVYPLCKVRAKQTFAFLLFGGNKRHSSGGARLFKADLFVSVNLQ